MNLPSTPTVPLIDDPSDVLALFVGIFGTLALVVAMFILTDIRDILAGALIANVATVINHFFSKAKATNANQ